MNETTEPIRTIIAAADLQGIRQRWVARTGQPSNDWTLDQCNEYLRDHLPLALQHREARGRSA